jgi:arylformamidase
MSIKTGEQMIDWTDAFDNSAYVAGSDKLADLWSKEAATFRNHLAKAGRLKADLAYGSGKRNRMDLFLPEGTSSGLVVFIHGGYWHSLDKSYWSHFATGILSHGWSVAIPSYTLAPDIRINEITGEIAAAIEFAADKVKGPVRLIGHSAGGHLVSRMICDDTQLHEQIQSRIEKIVSVSGVHDLRPLTLSDMNKTLRIDEEEAVSESSILHKPIGFAPITFWVGAGERPEFLRQTRSITERWASQGAKVTDVYEPDKNHFSVIEGLGDKDSPLINTLLN